MIFTGEKEEVMNIINKMPVRPIQNNAFKNNKDLSFTDTSLDWGFDKTTFSNGSSYGDLDNDGDLDLVINNVNQPLMIYKNKSVDRGANFLQVKLNGNNENTYAIGSKIFTYVNGKVLFSELIPTRGFQSSVDYLTTIGLGNNTKIDSLKIIWPDNNESFLQEIKSNQRISLSHADSYSNQKNQNYSRTKQTLFSEVKLKLKPHKENNYVDYDIEVLAPKMLSREGPAIAIGDVNSDGLDDMYIGNATGEASELLIQNQNGDFISVQKRLFESHKFYEDTAAELIDVDNDGDLDLFIGSGGNNIAQPQKYFKDRIYLNDGDGEFVFSNDLLPSYYTNTSVISPYDMDQDGDIDIFIGNRSNTAAYGITPKSIFLENIGKGRFKDATGLKAFDVSELGMITDAQWIDMNNDNIKDLVVVGEWMSPVIFENRGLSLEKVPSNLDGLTGWWNNIITGDFNQDGKPDFIFGNKGTNSTYQGSPESPARMFINDFDDNGTIDQILTRYIDKKDRPVHVRNELAHQISKIKKENLQFSQYAKKGIRDLFSSTLVDNSIRKEVVESKTLLLINKGENQFETKDLPSQVQWNSVNAGVVSDFNQDGLQDVLLSGGEDNLKPQFAKLDAGFGELLLGDGKGNFEWIPYIKSGLKVRGTVRESTILRLGTEGKKMIVFGVNDNRPVFYVYK